MTAVTALRRLAGFDRATLRRQLAVREARLRRPIEAALRRAAVEFGPGFWREAAVTGVVPDRVAELFVEAFRAFTDAMIGALREPIRKQELPDLVGVPLPDLARTQVGNLITAIGPTQLVAVRRQLALLFQVGPRVEFVHGIAAATGLTPRQTTAVVNAIQRALDAGATQARALEVGKGVARRLLVQRAHLIARTEAVRYTNAVVHATGMQARAPVLKQWVSARDANVDPRLCRPLDNGRAIPMVARFAVGGESFLHPPAHPGCLTGDSLVAPGGGIAAVSERWFDGDLVVLKTANSHRLTCTPNHPVLTDGGWVPAGLLNVGSYVIGHRITQRESPVDLHHQRVPTPIKQIAEAFRRAPAVGAIPMPTAPEDFHGDGEGSEIAVVWTDRLVRDGVDVTEGEHLAEMAFSRMQLPEPLYGTRSLAALFEGRAPATGRIMGRLGLAGPLDWRHALPFGDLGSRSATGNDSVPEEKSPHRAAADPTFMSEHVFGLTGEVARDQVVAVARYPFRGHVYNLQTDRGWYNANGIVVHNCRCVLELWRVA